MRRTVPLMLAFLALSAVGCKGQEYCSDPANDGKGMEEGQRTCSGDNLMVCTKQGLSLHKDCSTVLFSECVTGNPTRCPGYDNYTCCAQIAGLQMPEGTAEPEEASAEAVEPDGR